MSKDQAEFEFAGEYEGGVLPVKYPRLTHPVATTNKAEFIARYLFAFSMVTKHGNYIDAFAGPQEEDAESRAWAARRVLEEQPKSFGINDFYLFERNRKQFERLEILRREHSSHRGRIHLGRGDCNVLIPKLLDSGKINPRHATFALLDQRGMECSWGLVQALADFARGEQRKTELLYFLPVGWFHRSVGSASQAKGEGWWGKPDFEAALNLRKAELAEEMVERFKAELGYSAAAAWAFYRKDSGEGSLEYYMIHATDHYRAPGLIHGAYNKLGCTVQPTAEQETIEGLPQRGESPEEEDPHAAGASARRQGFKEKNCPYPPTSPNGRAWLAGLLEQEEKYLRGEH